MSKLIQEKNSTGIDSHTASFLPSYSYYFLTFNGIGQMYCAYLRGDSYMAAFILFLFLAFLLLELCFSAYQHLPPHGESHKKNLLKTVMWLLGTAILFSVLFQFAPYIHWIATLLSFVIATAGSGFIFYVYFIYDDNNDNCICCSSNEKIKSSHTYRPIEAESDKEVEQSVAVLDMV